MGDLKVKNVGVWKDPQEVYVKDAGIWKEAMQVFVKNAGTWKEMYSRIFAGSGSLNLVDFFGDGSGLALYKLDGDGTDRSGNYHLTGTATYTDFGKFGQAKMGTEILNNETVGTQMNGNASVSLWIKPITGANGSWTNVFCFTTTSSNGVWVWGEWYRSGQNGSCHPHYNGVGIDVSSGKMNLDEWNHIVQVQKDNNHYLYINGVMTDNFASTNTTSQAVNFQLGHSSWTTGSAIGVDQVRLFTKAVTATEVNALMNENAIITDGLILHLDAANTASYPGSGPTLTDLSGNSHNGTIVDATFSNDNGGCFLFDGNGDKITVTDSPDFDFPGDFTVSVWSYHDAFVAKAWQGILDTYPGGGGFGFILTTQYDTTPSYSWWNGSWYSSGDAPTTNAWDNIVISRIGTTTKMYKNSVEIHSFTDTHSYANGDKLDIGVGHYSTNYGDFDGKIADVMIYKDKGLTQDDVIHNFNSSSERFGVSVVMSGLMLYLDAANTASYSGSGTTWSDISGNGNNFTLDGSGITYSANSGGVFSLADGGAVNSTSITTSTTCTVVMFMKINDGKSLFMSTDVSGSNYLAAYRASNKEYHSNCGAPVFYMDKVDTPNVYDYAIDNQWHMLEFKNVDFSSGWSTMRFNQYSPGQPWGYSFSNSEIGAMMIYDRNLTVEESQQNFNTFKDRFGL